MRMQEHSRRKISPAAVALYCCFCLTVAVTLARATPVPAPTTTTTDTTVAATNTTITAANGTVTNTNTTTNNTADTTAASNTTITSITATNTTATNTNTTNNDNTAVTNATASATNATAATTIPTATNTTATNTTASVAPSVMDAGPSPATELLDPAEATDLQGTPISDPVTSYDAKKFLQNYGYMPTYNPSKGKWEFSDKYKTVRLDAAQSPTTTAPPAPSETAAAAKAPGNQTGPDTDQERTKFRQAVQSFQRRYKLVVTGSVDDDTLRLMQQPRCGVSDYEAPAGTKSDGLVETDALSKAKPGSAAIGRGTSKATIGNGSGALAGTPRAKLPSVGNGGSTISSPVAKAPGRAQVQSVASKSSAPIGVSQQQLPSLLSTRTPKLPPSSSAAIPVPHENTPKAVAVRDSVLNDTSIDAVSVEEDQSQFPTTTATASSAPTSSHVTKSMSAPSQDGKPAAPRPKRSAVADLLVGPRLSRTRRDYSYDGNTAGSTVGFGRATVTWRILTAYYSRHFSASDLRGQITQAFRRWAEVLPLRFVEMATGDILDVDIQIAFVDSTNSDDFDFEFEDEQLARSTGPWAIYFNDDIQWTYNSHQGKNLIKVAVHEVGHVLGLSHSTDRSSIMYPYYVPFNPSDNNFRTVIDQDTLQEAHAIHGQCGGNFDTILDWVRTVGNKRKYSSVFFRGDTMWVYENTYQRVKYGDPRRISDMWSGVPNDLDAALQILPRSGSSDNLYFFKGNKYYQYDNANRQLMTRDPVTNADISQGRLISDGWPAKPGFPRIPDNIDTAYYDKRDENVYFFKGNQVYAYDMQAGGCCLNNYPMTISAAYPYRYGNGGLPGNIDAAYYSINSRKLYFFKGDTFSENETYNPSHSTVVNRVGSARSWSDQWNNICEA